MRTGQRFVQSKINNSPENDSESNWLKEERISGLCESAACMRQVALTPSPAIVFVYLFVLTAAARRTIDQGC
jgi:hypothetical protein